MAADLTRRYVSAFALGGKGDPEVGVGWGLRVLGLSLEPERGQLAVLELKDGPVSRRHDQAFETPGLLSYPVTGGETEAREDEFPSRDHYGTEVLGAFSSPC